MMMIDHGTIAGMLAGGYTLHAYCRICERWAVIDLAALVAQGKGHLRTPMRTHCSYIVASQVSSCCRLRSRSMTTRAAWI